MASSDAASPRERSERLERLVMHKRCCSYKAIHLLTPTPLLLFFSTHTSCVLPDKELTRKLLKGKRAERSVRRIYFQTPQRSRFLTKDCFPLLLNFKAFYFNWKTRNNLTFSTGTKFKKHFRLVHNAELRGSARRRVKCEACAD